MRFKDYISETKVRMGLKAIKDKEGNLSIVDPSRVTLGRPRTLAYWSDKEKYGFIETDPTKGKIQEFKSKGAWMKNIKDRYGE